MEEKVLDLFQNYKEFAFIISICINVLIAVLGFLPSFFITGANILFFGFWTGILISFLGEAIGAIISFLLYRKGFKRISIGILTKYSKVMELINLEGKKAFLTVLSLRLMPFIPSGIITLAAAVGKINWISFTIASSIGKLPALVIEGYSVYHVTTFTTQGKIILFGIGVFIIIWAFRRSS